MPGKPPARQTTAAIDPARGGRVELGGVALDFPADVSHSGQPLTVDLRVRDSLPESPYRQLYAVFDVEATEPIPLNGHQQTERKVREFKRPVRIEVDLSGIVSSLPLSLFTWDQRLGHWWKLPTWIDSARGVAIGETSHFSSFGLGNDTQSPTPPQTLESFQTSLFTGAASAGYSLDMPPGTGGLAPRVTLTYSSQTPDDMNETWAQISPDGNTAGDNAENALQATFVGLGWNIELGAVFRRDNDTYRLMLEGSSYELELVDGSNPNDKRYRTKEDQFWLIRRIQDAQNQHNSTGVYWLVRTKNGTEYRFGYNYNSDMLAGANQGSYVAWASLLDRVKDTHGN
ncbi:MAG: hypothetical protein M1358_19420, partial [Chloroflexi bacterium]|nr:hypothetical protein [Chloroflexota bacterium]